MKALIGYLMLAVFGLIGLALAAAGVLMLIYSPLDVRGFLFDLSETELHRFAWLLVAGGGSVLILLLVASRN
ncbi:MAG TPA: hypothetical protein VEB18_01525 [Candidatus Paceibacterota bacterium]|nr:hypothetical protein [Candidatus Paceibacterota bacterium]